MLYMTRIGDTPLKVAQCFSSINPNSVQFARQIRVQNANTFAVRGFSDPECDTMVANRPIWLPTSDNDIPDRDREDILRRIDNLHVSQRLLLVDAQKNGTDVEEIILAQAITDTVNQRLAEPLNLTPVTQGIALSSIILGLSHEQLTGFHKAIDDYGSALKEFSRYQYDSPAGYLAGNRFVASTQLNKASTALQNYNSLLFRIFRNHKSNVNIPFSKGPYISHGLINVTRQSASLIGRATQFLVASKTATLGASVLVGGVRTLDAARNNQPWMKVASQETAKIMVGVVTAEGVTLLNNYARARHAFMAGRFFFALSPWGLAFVVATSVGGYVIGEYAGKVIEQQIDDWWPE